MNGLLQLVKVIREKCEGSTWRVSDPGGGKDAEGRGMTGSAQWDERMARHPT